MLVFQKISGRTERVTEMSLPLTQIFGYTERVPVKSSMFALSLVQQRKTGHEFVGVRR